MPEDGVGNLTNDSQSNPGAQPPPAQRLEPAGLARQLRSFGLVTLGLALCFGIPLWDLIRFAAGSELYSYILLVPFISLYLIWLKQTKFAALFPAGPQSSGGIPDGRDGVDHRLLACSPSALETGGGRLSGGDDGFFPAVLFWRGLPVFGEGNSTRRRFSVRLPDFHVAHPRVSDAGD